MSCADGGRGNHLMADRFASKPSPPAGSRGECEHSPEVAEQLRWPNGINHSSPLHCIKLVQRTVTPGIGLCPTSMDVRLWRNPGGLCLYSQNDIALKSRRTGTRHGKRKKHLHLRANSGQLGPRSQMCLCAERTRAMYIRVSIAVFEAPEKTEVFPPEKLRMFWLTHHSPR